MDSDSVKKAIIRQVLVESNTNNSRQLFERANEHCFDKCVPKPGSSMSSSETTCASLCMEKYINAWNKVNQTLLQRLQQEQGTNFST
ncbi:Tim10/DDP family zinc finger-domain-containing protein [Cercophora newfieldiana]|uniref:Mitochondrial import inner membrane translocase subunit n=1 Tax=Cercophora newfieldiana TaxID=92897 RepID=A0AA39Y5S8_9PEZI|nr:Tim10/DDP family zinc finger-domain-containing protein [Cercophora newfieldiana]